MMNQLRCCRRSRCSAVAAEAVWTRWLLPAGYTSSGSFCVSRQGAQDAVALPPNGTYPHGWTRSGSFCLNGEWALIWYSSRPSAAQGP